MLFLWFMCWSVHCPAACARSDYIVYGTTEYRGVCELCCITAYAQCWERFINSKYLSALSPLTGLEHLCCSHPCWSGTEWKWRRLHFVKNWRKGFLRRLHKEWNHLKTVSSCILSEMCFPCLVQLSFKLIQHQMYFSTDMMETTPCLTLLQTGVSSDSFMIH